LLGGRSGPGLRAGGGAFLDHSHLEDDQPQPERGHGNRVAGKGIAGPRAKGAGTAHSAKGPCQATPFAPLNQNQQDQEQAQDKDGDAEQRRGQPVLGVGKQDYNKPHEGDHDGGPPGFTFSRGHGNSLGSIGLGSRPSTGWVLRNSYYKEGPPGREGRFP